MIIKVERPPLFDEIAAIFPIVGKSILFAFGDVLYNPAGVAISMPLLAHEAVHGKQQGDDIEGWWRRYLVDKRFRAEQEIPAHQAEYALFCHESKSRHERQAYLNHRAGVLAGPLYGHMMSFENAKLVMKGKPVKKWQLQNS